MVRHTSTQAAEQDLVRLYLTDIGRHQLLEKHEETELAKAIEAGRQAKDRLGTADGAKPVEGCSHLQRSPTERRAIERQIRNGDEATSRFIQANLRLVVSIARRYQSSGLPLVDLIQEGNLGLIHAVEKFDWRKGFKFSTYATWWIRQAITRGIANTSRTIRLPTHTADLVGQANRLRFAWLQEHGNPATTAELAAELGTSEWLLAAALRTSRPPRSLSEPLGDDGDGELADLLADREGVSPADAAMTAGMTTAILPLLASLDDREEEVLRLRFGLDRGTPRTLDEVGAHFQLTRERIRQIEQKALTKLRHPSTVSLASDLLQD